MQKKRNIRFKAIDILIIILCIAGSAISALSFSRVYNRTLSKLNEEPIGTVVFKQRTAERRFADRFVWDRLRQSSSLYNGDTIRTIKLSEAVIAFKNDVSQLTIFENTMIKLFYNDTDGAKIDFSQGNLEVVSGDSGVTVFSGSSVITVEGKVDFIMNDDGLSFSVLEGSINFDGEEIESGNILSIDRDGVRSLKPAIAMTSFGSSARILGVPNGVTPVVFSWNESNFTSDTFVVVELALDRFYTRITETREVAGSVSVSIPVENGSFWWRAYPVNRGSAEPANDIYPSGSLEVIPSTTAKLITPANSAEITVSDNTAVSFFWTSVKGASSYIMEVSANANMSSPVISRTVQESGIIQSGLNTGIWYWRVTPVFPDWITGSVPPSAVSSFSLAAQVRRQETVFEESLATETGVYRTSDSSALAESLSTATFLQLPVIAAAGWNPNADPASVSKVSTERDVTTIEINIANIRQGEPRWAGAILNDNAFIQKLRNGDGVRFKAAGDGQDWVIIIPTSDIRAGGPTYRFPVSTSNGTVVECEFFYSQLRQPEWGAKSSFNKSNITNLVFERNDSHGAGSAEIKIFDFEVFIDTAAKIKISGNNMEFGTYTDADRGGRSAASIYISDDDVITLHVNHIRGIEYPYAGFTSRNNQLIQSLRVANGIRFKVLGDGRPWRVQIPITDTAKGNWDTHRLEFQTSRNNAVPVDVPFSYLKQPEWSAEWFNFDRNRITEFQLQPDFSDLGTAEIKVFDFEIY